jgi:predicted MFS family arabinose efflux permease
VTISDELLTEAAGQLELVEAPGSRETAAGPSSVSGSVLEGRTGTRQRGGHRAGGSDRTDSTVRPARYRDVFAVREYAGVFTAELCSLLGDQIAAVAVAVLLYERSGSPLLAALGYATVYLPWAVGGPLLSVLADRLPARRVMVGCDLFRAGLIGLAAVPGLPLALVALLVLTAAFLAPPFDAAVSSTLPQIVDGERYALAISIRSTVINASMLAGFAAGGVLVAAITPNGALGLDALSFAVSALILSARLQARPAAMTEVQSTGLLGDAWAGLRVVAADRRRYGPLLLGMAGAAYIVVPEGIATAYAHLLGYGAPAVGLLMASVATGHVVGAVAVGRLMTDQLRRALMWPMALLGAVPLTLCLARPGLVGTAGLFVLAGLGSSFQVTANTAFALAVPTEARGRAFGLAMTGMYAVQSIAVIGAGAAATLWSANAVVAGVAVLCALVILALRPLVVPARDRAHRTSPIEATARQI